MTEHHEALGEILDNLVKIPESQLEKIAQGVDSIVWRKGEYIIKKYFGKDPISSARIDRQLIEFYQKLTNRASQADVPQGLWFQDKYRIVVNPALSVSEVQDDRGQTNMVTLSRFIEGPTLKNYLAKTGVEYNQLVGWLKKLQGYFEEELKVKGLDLMTVNMKVNEEEKVITITDLNGSVSYLSANL